MFTNSIVENQEVLMLVLVEGVHQGLQDKSKIWHKFLQNIYIQFSDNSCSTATSNVIKRDERLLKITKFYIMESVILFDICFGVLMYIKS